MPFLLQPFHAMLLVLSEFVRKEQEKRMEFLLLENQILREKIGSKRVLLTDDLCQRSYVCSTPDASCKPRELI